MLAERGELTPEDADKLRKLAGIRNGLIHGSLGYAIDNSDIDLIASLAARMIESSKAK